MTVFSKIRRSHGQDPTRVVARPGGPALDLSSPAVVALLAEVEHLRHELQTMQERVDEVLDRESMHINAPHMECLTTAMAIERRGIPRAQHLPAVEETAAGGQPTGVWA